MARAYAAGGTYADIALTLGLAPTTVRAHLRTIYAKLGVNRKVHLAQWVEAVTQMPGQEGVGRAPSRRRRHPST